MLPRQAGDSTASREASVALTNNSLGSSQAGRQLGAQLGVGPPRGIALPLRGAVLILRQAGKWLGSQAGVGPQDSQGNSTTP